MMWERDLFWVTPDRVIISVTLFELYAVEHYYVLAEHKTQPI